MADLRTDIANALEGWMTPEQLEGLISEVLSSRKEAWVNCPHCKKKSKVEIADAKAVTSALVDLANQGFGRPKESGVTDAEKIHFERVVYMGGDENDTHRGSE